MELEFDRPLFGRRLLREPVVAQLALVDDQLAVELDWSGARGVVRDEDGRRFVSSMRLEVHARSGSGLFLGNLSVVADGGEAGRAEWTKGNTSSLVRPMRDVDGSMRYGLVNTGDLLELQFLLLSTGLRLEPGDEVTLHLSSDAQTTVLWVRVPSSATEESVVDLKVEVRDA